MGAKQTAGHNKRKTTTGRRAMGTHSAPLARQSWRRHVLAMRACARSVRYAALSPCAFASQLHRFKLRKTQAPE